MDERVAKAVLQVNDPEIILDFRRTNGKANHCLFIGFWSELQSYLDEITLAVNERRQGDILHMPFAFSIRPLKEMIEDRLKQRHPEQTPPIPLLEWIHLQFWPANPCSNRAIRKTGRFQVKLGIQVRQLCKDHPDSHYVSAILQYVRSFSVKKRSNVLLILVDDKCIVPVREPDCPVSTGVCGHNRSFVPLQGP